MRLLGVSHGRVVAVPFTNANAGPSADTREQRAFYGHVVIAKVNAARLIVTRVACLFNVTTACRFDASRFLTTLPPRLAPGAPLVGKCAFG